MMHLLQTDEEIEAERRGRAADAKRDRENRRRGVRLQREEVAARLKTAEARVAAGAKALRGTSPTDPGYVGLVRAKTEAEVAVATLTARLAHIDEQIGSLR